ncbi:hypothetical protein QEN19_002360 [Hanseniaspora menglaensis]
MEEVVYELSASATAGMLGKLVEFPFDTVKVRLQTNPNNIFANTWDCIKYTYNYEGITKGFYKGVSSPMLGAILENAVLFVTYGQTYKYLQSHNKNMADLNKIIISGGVAGSFASFVLTPVELVKCKLQVSNLTNINNNNTVLKTISETIRNNGVQGLWKGQSSTFLRESIGGCIWFSTYELSKKKFKNIDTENTSRQWHSLASGALAGIMFNFSIFPVDTIKSLVQIDHSLTVSKALRTVFAQNGIAGFYKGLGITLARAAPANAVIFYTFDTVKGFLEQL